MKNTVIAVFAALILTANTASAINLDRDRAQSMDDVHSLGVVYINHHSGGNSEAEPLMNPFVSAVFTTQDSP